MDPPATPPPGSDPRPEAQPLALVVEGDTALRIETADRLAEAGFAVIEAWNGPTALRQIERHPGLRLVIADTDLPDPDGRFALLRAIARGRPDIALVAASAGPEPEPGVLPVRTRFAKKPLTLALAREERRRLAR